MSILSNLLHSVSPNGGNPTLQAGGDVFRGRGGRGR